ncbi:glycine-rich domain-containing protein [Chitinilyticum piscinae]|uniref:TIGR04222 domain-containing membrane protein n=1 Tax=Chitinilyticum piscinae TaxID=2866724 RepID=A0A8J7K9H6_9NEIS|nr:hypothetical protein [Chitinilyticum piscinae]MBE9608134.1 hypothetical protein [Chitinilyticum piscinae]
MAEQVAESGWPTVWWLFSRFLLFPLAVLLLYLFLGVWPAVLLLGGVLLLSYALRRLQRSRLERRLLYIDQYTFPDAVLQRCAREAALDEKAVRRASHALRQYYRMLARTPGVELAMPSRAADELWHTHILFTREYREFCQSAFGRYLDHQPYVATEHAVRERRSLANSWAAACRDEGLEVRQSSKIPLLFAVDAQLGLAAVLSGSELLSLQQGLPHRSAATASDDKSRTSCGVACGTVSGGGNDCQPGGADTGSSCSDSSSSGSCGSSCGGGCGGGGGD